MHVESVRLFLEHFGESLGTSAPVTIDGIRAMAIAKVTVENCILLSEILRLGMVSKDVIACRSRGEVVNSETVILSGKMRAEIF